MLGAQEQREVVDLVAKLLEFIQNCYANGREPGIAEFTSAAGQGGDQSQALSRLLEVTGVPRLCSSELLLSLFEAIDNGVKDGGRVLPESIRRKLLSGLGEALDTQEREVRARVEGLLLLIAKARECEEILHKTRDAEQKASLQRTVDQGKRLKAVVVKFMTGNPSLMTPGVQALFADEDDTDLVTGLIDSCGSRLDFLAQSAVISSQARIRNTHVTNAFRGLSRAGITAIESFDRGLLDLLSLLEFDSDWTGDEVWKNKERIEQRIKAVMEEFNSVHREEVMSARTNAELAVARYHPAAVTELIKNKVLDPGLAGDVIQGEGRLHGSIRVLKDGLHTRRQELRKGWSFIEHKSNEALEVESRVMAEQVERLSNEHSELKGSYDTDVMNEDHYQFEIDRVAAELEVANETLTQQQQAHEQIRSRVTALITLQRKTMERLLEQLEAVEDKVRGQTKEVFKSLLGADLDAQRQVDIVEFGDAELSLSLIISNGKRLSPDAQVAVARTGNRQMQRTLLRGMQDALVVYARRFIPSELLLEVFRAGDLTKGIHV